MTGRAQICRRRAVGFTVVELLTTIGILMVLITLLAPMASKVRDQSRIVGCASNLRQVYLGTMAYAVDNNDTFFYAPTISETSFNAPYAFIMQSLGIINYSQGHLWRYLGGSLQTRQNMMTCPADSEEAPNNHPGIVRNFSYSFNAGLDWSGNTYDTGHNPPIGAQLHVAAIVSPWHKILIWEEVGPNDGMCCCLGGDRDDYPTQRHAIHGKPISDNGSSTTVHGNGYGNQCFADGHIEFLEPQATWNVVYYCDLRKER